MKNVGIGGMFIMGLFISAGYLNGAPPFCSSSASIMIPCPSGAHCHCEVKDVQVAVCEETICSGNRSGCKCYGVCWGIPHSSVCCCSGGPEGKFGSKKVEFEKIFILPHSEIEIPFEKYELKRDSTFFFYAFKEPSDNFFIGVDLANHKLHINLYSKKIVKENTGFWFKYIPENNHLFYTRKNSLKDTILEICFLDMNSLKDRLLSSINEDVFLLSSPFSVYKDKLVLKNKNRIEVLNIKSGETKQILFDLPSNIEIKYPWQNKSWFISFSDNYFYIFFNSLPYVIVLDTLFNIVKAYDFYKYNGIGEILSHYEEEYYEVIEKDCDFTTFSISQCFTISLDKVVWTFGNLCFIFEKGKPVKQIVFNLKLKLEKSGVKKIYNVVPTYISETSSDKILLNFGGLNFTYINKDRL